MRRLQGPCKTVLPSFRAGTEDLSPEFRIFVSDTRIDVYKRQLSDRKFAGSDTLATSYALSCALRRIAPDLIVAGRQAIDGDTAQVGPQVAEKLGLPQVTLSLIHI